jgi:hypothetical protein
LNNVVLIALAEVFCSFRRFVDPLPADGEKAVGHGRGAFMELLFVIVEIITHYVYAHVPIEWVAEQIGVYLFNTRRVCVCSQYVTSALKVIITVDQDYELKKSCYFSLKKLQHHHV